MVSRFSYMSATKERTNIFAGGFFAGSIHDGKEERRYSSAAIMIDCKIVSSSSWSTLSHNFTSSKGRGIGITPSYVSYHAWVVQPVAFRRRFPRPPQRQQPPVPSPVSNQQQTNLLCDVTVRQHDHNYPSLPT